MVPNWDQLDLTIFSGLLTLAVALVWAVVGGLVYWIRKLDDRQYSLTLSAATHSDVKQTEAQLRQEIQGSEARSASAVNEVAMRIQEDVRMVHEDVRGLGSRIDAVLSSHKQARD